MGKKKQTALQLHIHLCILLDVDFEMLKHSHMEKIHLFFLFMHLSTQTYASKCLENLVYDAKLIQPTCSEAFD